MKVLLLALFFLFQSNIYGQLTNAEVYDFEIGDVFQISYSSNFPGPPPVYLDTIVGKTYSVGLDSIQYTINRLEYVAPPNAWTPATFNFSTYTRTVTNLNQPAIHYSNFSCLTPKDTSLFDNCGNLFDRRTSVYDTSCFEPPSWSSELYKGLGGPYTYNLDYTSGSGNDWIAKKLTYYYSSQYGECGTRQGFVGLEELPRFSFSIFPNPSSDLIQITTNSTTWNYNITDATGKMILNGSSMKINMSIPISTLKSGVYLLSLTFNNTTVVKRFVKN